MEQLKSFYTYYVTDGVYHIYKFSIYGRKTVNLIHAGLAYDKWGNYTKKFLNLLEKYNIPKNGFDLETTASSYSDFMSRLYLVNRISDYAQFHPKFQPIFKFHYEKESEKLEYKAERIRNAIKKCSLPDPKMFSEYETMLNTIGAYLH
jgi:hypothetical protein